MEKEKNEMNFLEKNKYEKKAKVSNAFKLLIALCLCLLLSTGNRGIVNAQSQSIEKVDFKISSVKDFNTLITFINNGDDYTGKIVKVTADIDFSGVTFTSIPSFGGIFDGSGHTFTGISSSDSGVFKFIKSTGSVKNLTIKDSSFMSHYIGAIAYENQGTIENCSNYASITGVYAGGIVYINGSTGMIINCANYGDILHNRYNNDGSIGGIAFKNYSRIINCYNQGNLFSHSNESAGIVWDNYGQVMNSYNTGMAEYGIGGGTISSCYFLDTASDTAQFGTYTDNNAKAMTLGEMLSDSFVSTLNKGAANSKGTLKWESGALYPQIEQAYEVTFEKNFNKGKVGSNYSYAAKGTKVTLTAKPSNKYYTKSLTVNTEEGLAIAVTVKGNKFTFTMPEDNVVVSASFSALAAPKSVKYTKSNKTISWGKVADATGYEVYRSTSKTANFKRLKSVTALKYSDSKATSSTRYYYKVRAYKSVDGVKVYSPLSKPIASR